MARQTVDVDDKAWRAFLKRLVDVYGSAYGSMKKQALTEAIRLWLEASRTKRPAKDVGKELRKFAPNREFDKIVLNLLGEEETVLPLEEERRLLVGALTSRFS